jgi:hypothetical protein
VFWGHLWFIARLIVCSFIALPLLLFCGSCWGTRLIGALARRMEWPGALILFGLPPAIAVLWLRSAQLLAPLADWSIRPDWSQLGILLICYIYGYILFADERFERAIRRGGVLMLGLGVAVFLLELAIAGGVANSHVLLVTERLGQGFVTWFWVAAILSFGMRYLAVTNRALRYLTDATFPLYVLHMPALMLTASIVLALEMPAVATYGLLIVGTAGLTLASYELVIKRFRATRLLFGMRLRDRHALADPIDSGKAKLVGP